MTIRKGNIIRVQFRDHVQYASRAVSFCVYGRVYSVTKREIVVEGWHCARKQDSPKKYNPDLEVRYVILRSCIENISKLRPEEQHD